MNIRQDLESYREKIMARAKERMSRPTLTESLHEQNKKQAEKKSPWFGEFKADQATYLIMAVSAIFTAILGLILGMAPQLITNPDGSTYITFHTDFLHLFVALIYAVAFVTVTEAAFIVGKNKFHTREEANPTQHNTMLAMMILAGISIVGTGWAGGSIAASVLGFLTDFKEIPHDAQKWVVGVIPALLALYAYLLTAYRLSSEEEKAKRLTEQTKRKQQRDHQLQMDMADLEVEEMMMLAESKAYLNAIENGLISYAEAAAAKRAGKTLKQLEKEKGVDLDGDGVVGMPLARPILDRPLSYHPVPEGDKTQLVPIIDGHWECPNCHYANPTERNQCVDCGFVRDPNFRLRVNGKANFH
jgi:hypothetical protein